ncbi:uncharacterized protein si:ch211-195m9.3 isoform X2 [Electrophorus electricus]|uniref:uncharacterized protein si:ch211-195m9.3 isoform X2 n=1 Tax=Electrophorus electricus TaxID=8005 RepID=UPI0015D02031|nr:uncharacterized protein si:ch211-195m9.3 isoform X2 [Electrophorus electricus]
MAHNTALLALCILVTCSTQGDCTCKEESSQQCGELLFNVNKYTCCRRNIHNGSGLDCCGTLAYNAMESSCCKNEVTHGLGQAVSDCCGSKAYNPINQICCGGSIQNRLGPQASCCGSVVINDATHLCCAGNKVMKKTSVFHRCCGEDLYDNRTECCCSTFQLKVENRSTSRCCSEDIPKDSSSTDTISGTDKKGQAECSLNVTRKMDTEAHPECQYSGGQEEDENTSICCSGKKRQKKSGLTRCCGAEVYQLWEDGALCCDDVLYRDQPASSMCAGKAVYSPHRYTVCQGHVHLPAGKQCCGSHPYNPHKEICCKGHRHSRPAEDVVCCGLDAYSPSTPGYKCCAGHLHDLKGLKDQSEAECCGPLLLRKKQQCCYSTEKTLVYEVQDGHSCCGHWYYNMSLWRCCAGKLFPLTNDSWVGQRQEFRLLPHLSDYNTSTICREKMLLGTVVSEAVNQAFRSVVLMDVLYVSNTTITPQRHHEVSSLDHCSFPLLEPGRPYLWRFNGSQYEPIANVPDVAALHSILSHC